MDLTSRAFRRRHQQVTTRLGIMDTFHHFFFGKEEEVLSVNKDERSELERHLLYPPHHPLGPSESPR